MRFWFLGNLYHDSTARHANWTDTLSSLNGPEHSRHWELTAPHLPSLKASIQHDPENLSWAAGQNGTNCANTWNGREIFPVRHAQPHGHCCTHPAAPQWLLSWEAGKEKPGNSQEKTLHQPRISAPLPQEGSQEQKWGESSSQTASRSSPRCSTDWDRLCMDEDRLTWLQPSAPWCWTRTGRSRYGPSCSQSQWSGPENSGQCTTQQHSWLAGVLAMGF